MHISNQYPIGSLKLLNIGITRLAGQNSTTENSGHDRSDPTCPIGAWCVALFTSVLIKVSDFNLLALLLGLDWGKYPPLKDKPASFIGTVYFLSGKCRCDAYLR